MTIIDEMRAQHHDLRRDFVEFRREMQAFEEWSFVFWCGAVTAVAALAGVLKP